jgi:hypothetical protein
MKHQLIRTIRRIRATLCASRQEQEAFRRRRDLAKHRAIEAQRIALLEKRARGARIYAAWSRTVPALHTGI